MPVIEQSEYESANEALLRAGHSDLKQMKHRMTIHLVAALVTDSELILVGVDFRVIESEQAPATPPAGSGGCGSEYII